MNANWQDLSIHFLIAWAGMGMSSVEFPANITTTLFHPSMQHAGTESDGSPSSSLPQLFIFAYTLKT